MSPTVADCRTSSATPAEALPLSSLIARPKTARQPRFSHHSWASSHDSWLTKWCSCRNTTVTSASSQGSPSALHLSRKGIHALMLSVMRPKGRARPGGGREGSVALGLCAVLLWEGRLTWVGRPPER